MRIILDANFLIYCAREKIDYFSVMPVTGRIVIFSSVFREVEKIAKTAEKAKDIDAAKLSLRILNKNLKEKLVRIIKTEESSGDDAILQNVEKGDVVATMDRELKNKLKGKAKILAVKSRKKLEIV